MIFAAYKNNKCPTVSSDFLPYETQTILDKTRWNTPAPPYNVGQNKVNSGRTVSFGHNIVLGERGFRKSLFSLGHNMTQRAEGRVNRARHHTSHNDVKCSNSFVQDCLKINGTFFKDCRRIYSDKTMKSVYIYNITIIYLLEVWPFWQIR